MKSLLLLTGLLLSISLFAQTPEERLVQMGLTLPPVPPPAANYVNAVRTGNLLFLAGKGPSTPDGKYITGKLGGDLTIEQGYEAARSVALAQLAVLKSELGNLSKVKRIVKVQGMINSTPDFIDHSKVMNGFSDMMVAVFGEKGKHARSSVGMCSLPFNIAVEVELVVEIED
jgi:enamine deaminase RidA (YjgF/YER057c/UK114 family)